MKTKDKFEPYTANIHAHAKIRALFFYDLEQNLLRIKLSVNIYICFFPACTVFYLVQFVDDGILDIKTDNDLRTREDGLKEAQYGDAYYLCTIIFESGESLCTYYILLCPVHMELRCLTLVYCANQNTVNTRIISGMILCCDRLPLLKQFDCK